MKSAILKSSKDNKETILVTVEAGYTYLGRVYNIDCVSFSLIVKDRLIRFQTNSVEVETV
jgi:hypothetical protein